MKHASSIHSHPCKYQGSPMDAQDTIADTGNGSSINEAITFFSDEYFEAGWRRTALAAKAVRWGFNVLLTDVDIVWFQSPYSYLAGIEEVSMYVDNV